MNARGVDITGGELCHAALEAAVSFPIFADVCHTYAVTHQLPTGQGLLRTAMLILQTQLLQQWQDAILNNNCKTLISLASNNFLLPPPSTSKIG